MKIFTATQLKEWDQKTIRDHYEDSAALMEHASRSLVEQFVYLEQPLLVHIFCGTGNNGGDGLCMARMLAEREVEVKVTVVGDSQKGTPDFRLNLQRMMENDFPVEFLSENEGEFQVEPYSHVVDCLLGTGINRPAEGWLAGVIEGINSVQPFRVISIDIPSGLLPDEMNAQTGAVIRAHRTLTLEIPKRAMLVKENNIYVGEITTIDIGLDRQYHDANGSEYYYYDMMDAVNDFRTRPVFVHKNENGHVRLIAGSKGKIGACILSARAALRAGAGLLTATIPGAWLQAVQTALPEAMCETDEGADFLSSAAYNEKFSSTAIGPGIGQSPETALLIRKFLKDATAPCIFDADALNIIAEKKLLNEIPKGSILTPHVGEFHRLFGEFSSDAERLKVLRDKSVELGLIIVLKGAMTRVATPDGLISFNATGNPGLATAGSGDVLTGVLAAMMAKGYPVEIAARLGVFLHGLAGDLLRLQMGETGLLASDIADAMPHAIRLIHAAKSDPGFFTS